MFDSHVHFESLDGADGMVALVKRAWDAGVNRMIAVGGSPDMNDLVIEAVERYPGRVFGAIGCDREHTNIRCDVVWLDELLGNLPGIVGIGEIGLDFHYHPEKPPAQMELFEHMLDVAGSRNLPVIVHSRNAEDETLEMLGRHAQAWKGDPDRLGVLHCFAGSIQFAHQILEMGYYLGFSGIITFEKADDLRELAKSVPAERLLIETDTPYLAPVPCRGGKNEPAFLVHVAQKLAELRDVSIEEIGRLTASNTERLFNIAKNNFAV